ncbi:nitrite reductase small subunit NirD [Metabacillus arenae]|uniref:Nitrite reductase small subunit NirD n=1 Tax=Metabacillus arenae TaxID=2771434 RepID=A0A926RZZ7_9BACI|nr:nitrite reductase small subunit NirD [Metabacillus arenae]MBD1379534.1 nitrite reductase small subunit NirD [Metabacillus arenae]
MKTANRVKAINLSELPEKVGKSMTIHGQQIALFRLSNGKVKAIENRCPHKGGVLAEGIVCDEKVFCPLHDWQIDLNDGVVQAPDVGCVKTYKVEVEDDEVYLIL